MKQSLYRFLFFGAPLILMCCATTPDGSGIDATGRLKSCPPSPNCVSTNASDPAKQMAPLPYRGDRMTSRQLIVSIIRAMPRTTFVVQTDDYVHAEFRSRLFGFVDDVEFLFDDDAAIIHFRSASRTGYSDMGVNRQRMTAITETYQAANLEAATVTPGVE